jgi:hypothetical protein
MENDYIIKEAKVLSTDDDYRGSRIKVRLGGLDSDIKNDADLPYCFPLLPKLIHIIPKVNEMVLVILQKSDSGKSNRFYIGPVLSQEYFYFQDMYDVTAFNMLLTKKSTAIQNPEKDPDNNGTLPDRNDIAITGRKNSDIILKENELRLRCGYKEDPNGPVLKRLHFNKVDPAYIQLKYQKIKDGNGQDVSSFVNIVADRINLLSRDSKNTFNLTDRKEMISDEEMVKILEKAHPLVFGDELVEFLKKLIDIFTRHTHSYSMLPPSFPAPDVKTLETNLDTMLSKAVRIN